MEKMMIDCEYFENPCYVPKELCTMNRHGEVDDVISCAEQCESLDMDCSKCVIQKCFERLAEYEEIGLTPEQIHEVDKLYAEKCKEVAELKKSTLTGIELAQIAVNMQKLQRYQKLEEEDRLVILPEKGKDKKDCEVCTCNDCINKEYCCKECDGSISGCEEHYSIPEEDDCNLKDQ